MLRILKKIYNIILKFGSLFRTFRTFKRISTLQRFTHYKGLQCFTCLKRLNVLGMDRFKRLEGGNIFNRTPYPQCSLCSKYCKCSKNTEHYKWFEHSHYIVVPREFTRRGVVQVQVPPNMIKGSMCLHPPQTPGLVLVPVPQLQGVTIIV